MKQNNKTGRWIEILIILKVFLTFAPAVSYYAPPGLNLLFETIIYFSIVSRIGAGRFVNVFLGVLPIFVIFIAQAFLKSAVLADSYILLKYLLWVLVVYWIKYENKYSFGIKLLRYIVIVFIITSITTIIGNNVFPGASRFLAVGEYFEERPDLLALYFKYNIGDFVFVYSSVLLLPILIYIYKLRLINRSLTMILIVLIVILTFATEYTTAVLIAIISLSLFLFKKRITKSTFFYFIATALLVFIVSKATIPDVLYDVSKNVESESISSRLVDMADFLSGNELDEKTSDLQSRIDRNQKSIDIIKNDPILGAKGDSKIVGGHSLILDYYAIFGVLGLLMEFISFFGIFKNSVKQSSGTIFYSYALFGFILQLLLAYLNPQIFYHVFMLIYPLLCYISVNNAIQNDNKSQIVIVK